MYIAKLKVNKSMHIKLYPHISAKYALKSTALIPLGLNLRVHQIYIKNRPGTGGFVYMVQIRLDPKS